MIERAFDLRQSAARDWLRIGGLNVGFCEVPPNSEPTPSSLPAPA